MNLIRYQTPELSSWPTLDRWSNLRDELNSLFELPFSSNINRQDLFGGWSPALDLYQDNDNLIAVVELPGMQKEDIEISLHELPTIKRQGLSGCYNCSAIVCTR